MIIERLRRKIRETILPPPGKHEAALIQELRRKILELPGLDPAATDSDAEKLWITNRRLIREKLVQDDPRRFLTWEIIKHTMFVSDAPYIVEELKSLKSGKDWQSRWQGAIRESKVGLPRKYPDYPSSSGTLIHHAYSLSRFEERTGQRVEDLSLVVEFGGGYGSMCRLIHNLGFRGRYIIFDLPELSILQRFFLRLNGIEVLDDKRTQSGKGVACVTGEVDFDSEFNNQQIDLFIATWSLSETSCEFRRNFLERIPRTNNFLISYQNHFGEVDNRKFFSEWSVNKRHVKWSGWEIEHLPGHHYLVGCARL